MHICDLNERWPEYDARGIFLTYVCPECVVEKLSQYRNDVLYDENYGADEPIDEEFYHEWLE